MIADIGVLRTQGEARTAEMAAKLKTDCQMSLDNYNTQLEGGGSDLTKLYELDGVEYDAKVRTRARVRVTVTVRVTVRVRVRP